MKKFPFSVSAIVTVLLDRSPAEIDMFLKEDNSGESALKLFFDEVRKLAAKNSKDPRYFKLYTCCLNREKFLFDCKREAEYALFLKQNLSEEEADAWIVDFYGRLREKSVLKELLSARRLQAFNRQNLLQYA